MKARSAPLPFASSEVEKLRETGGCLDCARHERIAAVIHDSIEERR